MSSKPARKPQKPGTHVPGRSDRGTIMAAGRESHALLGLVRLIGRQAAREFIRKQRSHGNLTESPDSPLMKSSLDEVGMV